MTKEALGGVTIWLTLTVPLTDIRVQNNYLPTPNPTPTPNPNRTQHKHSEDSEG